jgi:hypothetical protein
MACNAEQRHPQQAWRPQSASADLRGSLALFSGVVRASGADGATIVSHRSGVDAASRLSH